jgi:hypothetical protein
MNEQINNLFFAATKASNKSLGHDNHSFTLGYIQALLPVLLNKLELTDVQKKILQEEIEVIKSRYITD